MSEEEELHEEFAQEETLGLDDDLEEVADAGIAEGNTEEDDNENEETANETNFDEDEIDQEPERLPISSDGPILKKMKRPPSKWILYLGEQRKILAESQPAIPFGEQTKVIAQSYKLLSPEEHTRLDEIVKTTTEIYRNSRLNEPPTTSTSKRETDDSPAALQFPLARVRKTMKMDPEVKNVNRDAVALVTKAAELFVARMALKCRATSAMRGAKSINGNDVIHTIHADDAMEFLRWDFPKRFLQTPTTKQRISKEKEQMKNAATTDEISSSEAVEGVDGSSAPEKRSTGRGRKPKLTTNVVTTSKGMEATSSTRPKTNMHSFFHTTGSSTSSSSNSNSIGGGIQIAKKRNLDDDDEEVVEVVHETEEIEEIEEIEEVEQEDVGVERKEGKEISMSRKVEMEEETQLPHTVALDLLYEGQEDDGDHGEETAEAIRGEEETQIDGNGF